MTDIGFVGAGMMGSGMATRLVEAGHRVRVIVHKRPERVEALVAQGAILTTSLRELVQETDVLITCVSDARAVEDLAVDILEGLKNEQLWIEATTSDPQTTRRLAERVEHLGGVFADAPVVGSPAMAKRGELASLVGCRREKFNRVKDIVDCYSQLVQRFGDPASGHTAKLLNNFVTQSTGMLLVEAFSKARQLGVDWRALYDVMCAGAARSGTLEKMVGPALDGRFDGSQFSIANARKDIAYYRALSATLDDQSSGLADATFAMLDAAVDAGRGDDHVSSLLARGSTPLRKAG